MSIYVDVDEYNNSLVNNSQNAYTYMYVDRYRVTKLYL